MTKEEAKGLMKELCEPEDDEGFMPFMRKYYLNMRLFTKKLPSFLAMICKQQYLKRFGNVKFLNSTRFLMKSM